MLKDAASVIDTKIDFDRMDFDRDLDADGFEEEDREEADQTKDQMRKSLLREMEAQRETIIKEAMEDGEDIRLRARETGYNEGFHKGSEDGFKQGMEEGKAKGMESGYIQGIENAREEADQIKRNAIELLENAQDEVCKYIVNHQQRIIDLAAQMAESIVHSTIDTSSDNILQLIKPIIQQFRKVESIIITCNPKNYDYLKKSMYEIENKYEDIKFIILEDGNLEKNGCTIENENQIIDLQIKKQLKNIVEKINNLE